MNKAEMRCAWLTDKYILCLLALFPLFTGFHGYANLTAAKFWLYTGVTALWALGIAACLCTGARLFAKKPGAFFYLTCAFLVWNLVSAALSPWREKTFLGAGRYDGLFTQFLYALTALGIARWGRKKIIYVRVFGASVFLCSAAALWQIAGGNPLGLYPRLALCRRGNALFRHVSRHGGQYPDPRLRAFSRGAGARIYGG